MIFSSVEYVGFLLAILVLLALVRSLKAQKVILLLGSYYFYARWDWRFLALLAGLSLSTYGCTKMIREGRDRKAWLIVSVAIALGTLGYFKYADFFIGTFIEVTGLHMGLLEVVLPVGISFIVFEVISYAVDVYRGEAEFEDSFLDFAVLVAFFPHLIAGPILRPNHFLPQLSRRVRITVPNLSAGAQLFVWGLMKKILVADRLSQFVETVFNHPGAFSPATTWLGVFAYALQIYGDFSGYTDMAIGSARMMGFELPQNFNLPYLAKNVTDFWRRWHISLSTWLRNYLYIPLGGNRRGVFRTYENLAIVMLLGGLWHGANWNFCLWGGIHGLGLIVHRIFSKGKTEDSVGSFWITCGRGLTFLFVVVAWVPFRSLDWHGTLMIWEKMFGFLPGEQVRWVSVSLLYAVPCLIVADLGSRMWFNDKRLRLTRFTHQLAFCLAAIGILVLAPPQSSPFIYFRF